jgi:subtilase family serine protease
MFKLSFFLFSLILFSDAFMSPQEMYSYYNLIPIENRILNGSTSIAILNAFLPPTLEKDLDLFCSWYNLPPPQIYIHHTNYMSEILKTIHVMTEISMESKTRWYREMNMDVQWAHAMSPGIPIHIVISGGTTLFHMNQALRFIVSSLSVEVVSLSWGVHHTINHYDISLFETITSSSSAPLFVVASGDSPQPYWPACSSHVLSVGGTIVIDNHKINIDDHKIDIDETEMNWSESGGGTCSFYQPNSNRLVPDVGFMASPGVLSYQEGKQVGIAGTSIGAPIWASLIASSPITHHLLRSTSSSISPSFSFLEWIYSNLSIPYLHYIQSSNISDIIKHNVNISSHRPYNIKSGLGVPFHF